MIYTFIPIGLIAISMFIGNKFSTNKFIGLLVKTGQMTLSHYVIHLTIGMIILSKLTNKKYTGLMTNDTPTEPLYIFIYAFIFFIMSVLFSHFWSKKFRNGLLKL